MVVSPSCVGNMHFLYVIAEFISAKFVVCGLLKRSLSVEDVRFLFQAGKHDMRAMVCFFEGIGEFLGAGV